MGRVDLVMQASIRGEKGRVVCLIGFLNSILGNVVSECSGSLDFDSVATISIISCS
jgi:hypothetical protein